jgi:hypothetical protein
MLAHREREPTKQAILLPSRSFGLTDRHELLDDRHISREGHRPQKKPRDRRMTDREEGMG